MAEIPFKKKEKKLDDSDTVRSSTLVVDIKNDNEEHDENPTNSNADNPNDNSDPESPPIEPNNSDNPDEKKDNPDDKKEKKTEKELKEAAEQAAKDVAEEEAFAKRRKKLPDNHVFEYGYEQAKNDLSNCLKDKKGINYLVDKNDGGATHSLPGFIMDNIFDLSNNSLCGISDGTNKQRDNEDAAGLLTGIVGKMMAVIGAAAISPFAPVIALILFIYIVAPDSVLNSLMEKLNLITMGFSGEVLKVAGALMNDEEMKEGKHQKSFSDKLKEGVKPSLKKREIAENASKKVTELVEMASSITSLGNAILDNRENMKIAASADKTKLDRLKKLEKKLSNGNIEPKELKEELIGIGIFANGSPELKEGGVLDNAIKFLEKNKEGKIPNRIISVLYPAVSDLILRTEEMFLESTNDSPKMTKQSTPSKQQPTPTSESIPTHHDGEPLKAPPSQPQPSKTPSKTPLKTPQEEEQPSPQRRPLSSQPQPQPKTVTEQPQQPKLSTEQQTEIDSKVKEFLEQYKKITGLDFDCNSLSNITEAEIEELKKKMLEKLKIDGYNPGNRSNVLLEKAFSNLFDALYNNDKTIEKPQPPSLFTDRVRKYQQNNGSPSQNTL